MPEARFLWPDFFWVTGMNEHIRIGMSGWSYRDWKGIFYPEEMRSSEWLDYYAHAYSTAEINSSFYHLPRAKTVENWKERVPEDFRFCPKMSKYLTHIKKLQDPDEPLHRFFEVFAIAKDLMGPVLVQLPPSLKFDKELAKAFFTTLRTDYSDFAFALEARHVSWLEKDALTLMKKYNIAWVISQSGVGFPYLEAITSENIYIRFHGPGRLYASSYSDEMLDAYAGKIRDWVKAGHRVWAYFNNTMRGIALDNANALTKMIQDK
jgi:uncharacterized protein YecE (DUF72 family)